MPTNLELKARFSSAALAHDCARRCGAESRGTLMQEDTYFRIPRGRLKLREEENRAAELIYYERSEETEERWSHYTKEPVGEARPIKLVLGRALGVLAVVRKRRDLYIFRDARIHIDDVDGLGTFLEFEVTGGETPATLDTMRELRAIFGVRDDAVVKVSYSDMITAKRISEES